MPKDSSSRNSSKRRHRDVAPSAPGASVAGAGAAPGANGSHSGKRKRSEKSSGSAARGGADVVANAGVAREIAGTLEVMKVDVNSPFGLLPAASTLILDPALLKRVRELLDAAECSVASAELVNVPLFADQLLFVKDKVYFAHRKMLKGRAELLDEVFGDDRDGFCVGVLTGWVLELKMPNEGFVEETLRVLYSGFKVLDVQQEKKKDGEEVDVGRYVPVVRNLRFLKVNEGEIKRIKSRLADVMGTHSEKKPSGCLVSGYVSHKYVDYEDLIDMVRLMPMFRSHVSHCNVRDHMYGCDGRAEPTLAGIAAVLKWSEGLETFPKRMFEDVRAMLGTYNRTFVGGSKEEWLKAHPNYGILMPADWLKDREINVGMTKPWPPMVIDLEKGSDREKDGTGDSELLRGTMGGGNGNLFGGGGVNMVNDVDDFLEDDEDVDDDDDDGESGEGDDDEDDDDEHVYSYSTY